MASLKASEEGLRNVDRARKRKGWNKYDRAWSDLAATSVPTLKRFWRGIPIQAETFQAICDVVGVDDWEKIVEWGDNDDREPGTSKPYQVDWDGAPDVSAFYGRNTELTHLKNWILDNESRLVAISGMGGIGKTALTIALAKSIQERFETIIYRSLKQFTSLTELLCDLLQVCAGEDAPDELASLEIGLARLIRQLSNNRCLLILDDLEAILRGGELIGSYRPDCQDYEFLFKRLADAPHKSCLVAIGREQPKDLKVLQARGFKVESLSLSGLDIETAKQIFQLSDGFAEAAQLQKLIELYQGNPLTLNFVWWKIQNLFAGNLSEFLSSATLNFDDINQLLEEHFDRLSDLERQIVCCLASAPEPLSLNELREKIGASGMTDAIDSTIRRGIVKKTMGDPRYTLDRIVKMYVNQQAARASTRN